MSLFKVIDDQNAGFLDFDSLKKFLRKMGHFATDKEIVAILVRMDANDDY